MNKDYKKGIAILLIIASLLVLLPIYSYNSQKSRILSLPCSEVENNYKSVGGLREDCLLKINMPSQTASGASGTPDESKRLSEIIKGKNDGSICISPSESWHNVGRNTCVAYRVGQFYRSSSGNMFLNEKTDYKNGFSTAILVPGLVSMENAQANYQSIIAVSGSISMFENHPQIIVTDLNQITNAKVLSCGFSYGCAYSK